MAFPTSPTNGQTASVNGITYTYSDTYGTWTRLRTDANVITSLANAAFDRANAAYNAANTATDPWVRTQANNAYDKANSGATFANGAFVTANAAFTSQNTTADFANGAFVAANSGAIFANAAFLTANSAASFANGAFTTANLKFNTSGGTISGDVTVSGNLIVVGTSFYANTETVLIKDNIITLNAAISQSGTPVANAGIEIDRGTSANAYLIWSEDDNKWVYSSDGTTYYEIADANRVNNSFDAANSAASFANGAFTQANSNYTSAVTKLAVTTPGMYYSIDQYSGNNPTIYIRAGETIAFDLDVSGHPFMVRVSSGGSNYNTGLTHIDTDGTLTTGSSAQGQVTGTLYWKVPYNIVGSTYVYQCSIHSGMVGNIVIDQPTVIAFTQANNAFDKANSGASFANGAFDAANSAASFANASFITANASFITANASYNSQNITAGFANGAFAHANAAFNQANTGGTDAWVRTQANNAYDTANSGAIFANGAFTAANTADSKATSSGLFANASFDRANAAYNAANTSSTDSYARNNSNAAYSTANSGASFANAAFDRANAAFAVANTGSVGATPVSIYSDRFTANGATTTFTLSTSPTSENYIIVVVDGITQLRDTYSVSGNVVTFDTTFENGANVEVTAITGGGSLDPYAANTANLAYTQANAAFAAANSAGGADTYARNTANAAFITANAAFIQANTGGTSLSKAIAMSIVFGF